MQIYVSPRAEHTSSTSVMNERGEKKRLLTRWLKKEGWEKRKYKYSNAEG